MEGQLLTYRRFNDMALAENLIAVLEANNFDYEVRDNSIRINPLLNNAELDNEYLVKIKQLDFEKVNELLLAEERQHLYEVESDYYLLAFTNDELMNVLTNYDEWGTFDVSLARKLLNERGVPIDDDAIERIKTGRLHELEKPAGPQTLWVIAGYIFAFCGGVLGIFIGWHLSRHKKILPDGKQVYAYLEPDRKNGNRIFILSTVFFIIAIIMRFWSEYFRLGGPF